MILLPDTVLKSALEKAETLREALEKVKMKFSENASLSFTVSFGVASLSRCDNNLEQLLKAADGALYEAKRAGRNCVKAMEIESVNG